MKYSIFVLFKDPIDSKLLYSEVAKYYLNVTDFITYVTLHGDIPVYLLTEILEIISKYGFTEISIKEKPL